LDIDAWKHGGGPDIERVAELASECFMPLGYGGGLSNLEQVRAIFRCGVEKVLLNTALHTHPGLVSQAADAAGSQSVVAVIDVRRNWRGRPRVFVAGGTVDTGADPVEWARRAANSGAGEIILNSIDRDGTQAGYDLDLLRSVAQAVSVPVVAAGGAGGLADIRLAIDTGAAAAAAGSMFVFHGRHRAVLITYPDRALIQEVFSSE
jgi:cyclase